MQTSINWRFLQPQDLLPLSALTQACTLVDGQTKPFTQADLVSLLTRLGGEQGQTLGGWDEQGRLVGAGWLEIQTNPQGRAFLNVWVLPPYRPALEAQIISWLEGRASYLFSAEPHILRLDFYDKHALSIQLYESLGYHFSHAEDEMHVDLMQPLPGLPLPQSVTLERWSEENAADFHQVYVEAFCSRPNFPNWSQATWVSAFIEAEAFRTDWSWLMRENGTPVAYTVCHVTDGLPMIVQIGVIPSRQGQGLGAGLIRHNLRQFATTGFQEAALEVNENNPKAIAVYQKLGFRRVWRYTSYQKNQPNT